ncbi:hypothetical protein [Sediminibacillus massiliensis]|uniref:hypothetical protein n=1 Tax=Sediminibacillus massiliensis TaxID=1926277 RepID=UPI000988606F|nr:hypothetical protein [Sediminibacillus massiliensis]
MAVLRQAVEQRRAYIVKELAKRDFAPHTPLSNLSYKELEDLYIAVKCDEAKKRGVAVIGKSPV